jgi:hypothetical protein
LRDLQQGKVFGDRTLAGNWRLKMQRERFLNRTVIAVTGLVCGLQLSAGAVGPVAAVDAILPAVAPQKDIVRIGYVPIRDYSGRVKDTADLNIQLNDRLKALGFQTVELAFQTPAELEEAARGAGCHYVLYAEIIAMRQPMFDKLGSAFHAKTVHAEVEIEFRLFGMDEVLPRVSTSLTAHGKARRMTPATSQLPRSTLHGMSAFAPSLTVDSSEAPATDPFRVAFNTAFDKQARLVAAGVRSGPVR